MTFAEFIEASKDAPPDAVIFALKTADLFIRLHNRDLSGYVGDTVEKQMSVERDLHVMESMVESARTRLPCYEWEGK